jgi:hypothetical protein
MNSAKTHALLAAVYISVALHSGSARAQGGISKCSDLPSPIYMVGTTAVEPLVRHFGAKLAQLPAPQTLLWNQNYDGCNGVDRLAFQNNVATLSTFNYYQEVSQPDGTTKILTKACNSTIGYMADLVINDTFWTSCTQSINQPATEGTLPVDYHEYQGPVQGLLPIVQNAYYYYSDIMAEEILDLYVCGGKGHILTFTDNTTIFDYCDNTGMRALWANSLGLKAFNAYVTNYVGCPTATAMVTNVNGGALDSSIGYTSTEVYDESRDLVRPLKVQGLGQNLAYLPDTDITSRDKINIREGRYTMQGSLKLVAHVNAMDAGGEPQADNPAAKHMIDWLQGNPVQDPSLQLPFDIIDVYAQSGVVPQCAMKVTKDTDAPVFRYYQPQTPCNCYFELQATGVASPTECVPCKDSSTCSAGKTCYFHGIPAQGFCE